MNGEKVYSLSTILKGIKAHIESRMQGKYFWLKAEIANINFQHSTGHCYLELTETKKGQNLANCKGTIWKSALIQVKNTLGDDFNNVIKKGNEIVCLAEIQFTERFGLNINIIEIDLNFNIGALERRKQETILRLQKENLLAKNKQHILPTVIQKIAIVGSDKTAGITDLLKQLKSNIYGYCFEVEIFSCMVQGDKAQEEIINRLRQLNNSRFDVIALVRGGGSKLDLDIFNSYDIAKEIALHSHPIFTGIGHETDTSVADLCSNLSHKTPTALGSFIVERARSFEIRFISAYNYVIEYKNHFIRDRKNHLRLNVQSLTSLSSSFARLRRGELHTLINRINTEGRKKINIEKNKISLSNVALKTAPLSFISGTRNSLKHILELIQINSTSNIKQALNSYRMDFEYIQTQSRHLCAQKLSYMSNVLRVIEAYHPDNILSKGYAIPRFQNELLKGQKLNPNDQLEIELKNKILIVSYIKTHERWKKYLMNKLLKS